MSSVFEIALPEPWSVSPIKHATTLVSRGTAPDYVDDGPVRMISQAANQQSGIDWQRCRFHSYSGNPMNLKGHLRSGDILINSTGTGTLGRIGYFEGSPDHRPCVADGHVTVIRTADAINSRFAYYWLLSSPFSTYLHAALTVGATNQIELNRERLRDAPIPIPPFEDQLRIADFLDDEISRIDRLSKLRTDMRSLLLLKRARIIDETVGLSTSSPHRPAAPLKHLAAAITVGIVVTPANWYVESGGVPALRGVNVKPGLISTSDLVQISNKGHIYNIKSRLQSGDVVVVRTGQAGAAAVVPPSLDGANCIDLIIVRPGNHLDPRYLTYVLNSEETRRRINENSVGSIQSHFNVGAMKQIPVPILSLERQRAIALELDYRTSLIDSLDSKLTTQESTLAERRQALITAAVTGQFDISAASGRNTIQGV